MAEIHVQPRGPRLWPWLVALGVLTLLIVVGGRWWNDESEVLSSGDIDPYPAVGVTPIVPSPIFPIGWVAVRRYDEFAARPPEFGELNRAHEYTRNGLQYLASAIEEVAGDSNAFKGKVAALRESAEALNRKTAVDHAEVFAATAAQAADALRELQQARYPTLFSDVDDVREAADAIDERAALLSQGQRVTNFFAEAAQALRAMGATPAPVTSDTGGNR